MAVIHGAGCALIDHLYPAIDFHSAAVGRLAKRAPGDGGLTIGGLVFADALERFAGQPLEQILQDLTGDAVPQTQNVGGPAIVSLVTTAQLLPASTVRYFGAVGDDSAGSILLETVARTPLNTSGLVRRPGPTAATHVLSDSAYDAGHGERMFINLLGVAARWRAADLADEFYGADVVQLGGTALVPRLHAELAIVLERARAAGALTVVNTVYDFLAESAAPGERWTLGSDAAYRNVDLLITDAEEAARLSGYRDADRALEWLLTRGTGAVVVTDGPRPVRFAARGDRFLGSGPETTAVLLPTGAAWNVREGDTTGCGDNFAGGLVAGVAEQLSGGGRVDLRAALDLAVGCGAFCLTHRGGTWIEPRAGEKRRLVAELLAGGSRDAT